MANLQLPPGNHIRQLRLRAGTGQAAGPTAPGPSPTSAQQCARPARGRGGPHLLLMGEAIDRFGPSGNGAWHRWFPRAGVCAGGGEAARPGGHVEPRHGSGEDGGAVQRWCARREQLHRPVWPGFGPEIRISLQNTQITHISVGLALVQRLRIRFLAGFHFQHMGNSPTDPPRSVTARWCHLRVGGNIP